MIQILSLLLPILLYFLWFGWKLKQGLHMLQQNSYLNGHYLKWSIQHLRRIIFIREFLPIVTFFAGWFFLKQYTFMLFGCVYLLLFLFAKIQLSEKAVGCDGTCQTAYCDLQPVGSYLAYYFYGNTAGYPLISDLAYIGQHLFTTLCSI